MEKSTFQVLVVDDYEPWRRFASSTLQKQPELRIVGEAADGLEAVQIAQQLQPDLILLDIGLPTLNGIMAARRIKEVCPGSKILFVSENRSRDIAEEALSTGAHGYVVKSVAATELLPAVEAVLQGKQFVSGSLTGPASAGHENGHIEPRRGQQVERHEIKFYPDNPSFVNDFAQFIEDALKIGNAVVIATESLRTGILQRLRTSGVDPSSAAGRYFPLDISDPLSTSAVGKAAEAAILEGVHVAVGWECTLTLWAQGRTDAAIQREHLLRELSKTVGTDVRCGCVLGSHDRDQQRDIVERICAEHSAVYS